MQRRLTPAERQALYSYREARIYLEQNGISNFSDRISEMLGHNTTDGLPFVEPPLTDEDAMKRPWVMMRDTEAEPWRGPRVLAACCGGDYYAFTPSVCGIIGFRYCRRATPEEIAAAGLEVTE